MCEIEVNQSQFESSLAIAWVGLKFYRDKKLILNNINGSIDLGTITALMGPSGAGKSTLLECINGREITGIDCNTKFFVKNEIPISSSFIVQDVSKHLLSGLTALESLLYASEIKNTTQYCIHKKICQDTLRDLGFPDNFGLNLVDDCSGGEQKRLAIALELTSKVKPNLLCIDEPTSGLDSCAAEGVIDCLKKVSQKYGIAVVTSIHQPNNELIIKFDKLYVLAKDGICVYEGGPKQLETYLANNQITLNENQVAIEILIEMSSRLDQENNAKSIRLAELHGQNRRSLEDRCDREGQSSDGLKNKSSVFIPLHVWYLTKRSFFSMRARWTTLLIQAFLILFLAYIMIQLFNKNVGKPDGCCTLSVNNPCHPMEDTISDDKLLKQNLSLIFFALLAVQFLITIPQVLVFTTEVRIFLNEHKNGWYSTLSYFLAKTLVELPFCLLISIIYGSIIYLLSHQINEHFRLILFICTMIAGTLTAQGLGFATGIVADTSERLANVLSVGVYLFNLLLCGFFAPVDDLPNWIHWITYLSFAKQSLEMQIYIIYGFDRCPKGTVSQTLLNMDIVEQDKYITNAITLGIHLLLIRVIALVFLLLKANKLKAYRSFIRTKMGIINVFRSIRSRCVILRRTVEDGQQPLISNRSPSYASIN